MKHPLVSVIIPNYNHAPFLDERIGSVLNQDYDNLEVIILDDKSTDDSLQVINKYAADGRVSHIVANDVNSGSPFKQWKKGFELSKGELIWIAESDDYCERGLLSALVSQFEEAPGCSLAFCRSVKVDATGKRLGEEGLPADLRISGRDFVRRYLSRYNYVVNASSALFAKAALVGMDDAYTQFRGCGDWIFWIEIAASGSVAYVNQPLNYFRQHGTNTTAQQTRTGRGEYEVIEVTRYLRTKKYIGAAEYFRAQVVHVFSLKYGKLRAFFPEDIRDEIVRAWDLGLFGHLAVFTLYALQCLGIRIVKR